MTHSFPTRRSSDLGEMAAKEKAQAALIKAAQDETREAVDAEYVQALEALRRQHADELKQKVAQERSQLETERSEEHTSELKSLMRISYAVFCLKKKKKKYDKDTRKINKK